MQDEPTEGRPPSDPFQTDVVVMNIMFEDPHPWPWSVRELALEYGREIPVVDAVVALQAAGLVHRLGEFVFPTRAAARMWAIKDAS